MRLFRPAAQIDAERCRTKLKARAAAASPRDDARNCAFEGRVSVVSSDGPSRSVSRIGSENAANANGSTSGPPACFTMSPAIRAAPTSGRITSH